VAPNATLFRFVLTVSDVDRSVYETLDVRVARHPSETMRYMLTRTIAYALSWEEGIAFSKGGISSTDEPPIAVRDPTGLLLAWIDVGAPSAERLHKASKAARRVALFTANDLVNLRREVQGRPVHAVEAIEVFRLEPSFLDAVEPHVDKLTKMELVRNDGVLYVTLGATTIEGTIARETLVNG
jgi:uncharacterized protein YaeQ